MKDKTILITGANSGIGKVTALELAKMDARVVMLCRNAEKGKRAQNEIIQKSGNDQVELMIMDLADLNSVRSAAEKVLSKYSTMDVLINNAGGYFSKKMLSAQGHEYTFAANHLGHFLFTSLLLDKIKQNPAARIINVSSAAHQMGHMRFDDLMFEKKYSAIQAYAQAKLANVLFTKELARKLNGTGVTANALHPGSVRTNFGRNTPGVLNVLIRIGGVFLRSPEKGAETSVYLASSNEVEAITGEYFVDKKIKRTKAESYDEHIANKLWEVSEQLTGLKR